MAKKLEKFNHNQVNYFRPEKKWICGHTKYSNNCVNSCPLGPDKKGKCLAKKPIGQCFPIKIGDRWECSRDDAKGGKCSKGPLPNGNCCNIIKPCQPVLSQRFKRKYFVIYLTLFTLSVCLIFLTNRKSYKQKFIIPGKLNSGHSSQNLNCNNCHSGFEDTNNKNGLKNFINFSHAPDSEKCLNCHSKKELTKTNFFKHDNIKNAFFAHGFSQEELKKKSKNDSKNKLSLFNLIKKKGITGKLECAVCHREHQGNNVNFTNLSDKQCQICHQEQFKSFHIDHPSFAKNSYPFRKRNNIIFDHQLHFYKYFKDKKKYAPKGYNSENPSESIKSQQMCLSCHDISNNNKNIIVKNFEQSCISCHQDSTKGGQPIVFLNLPNVDNSLKNSKISSNYILTPLTAFLFTNPKLKKYFYENSSLDLGNLNNEDKNILKSELQEIYYQFWNQGTG